VLQKIRAAERRFVPSRWKASSIHQP
jgi:hypothetical protein